MKKTPTWFWPCFASLLFGIKVAFLAVVIWVVTTQPHPIEGPVAIGAPEPSASAEGESG